MNNALPARADIVVVGGGFAGVATACFLARRGVRDILLLEAADQPGSESSGRNAGILRRFAEDPVLAEMLHHSAEWIRCEGREGRFGVRESGIWLLAGGEKRDPLHRLWETAVARGLPCRWRERREVSEVPAPLRETPWDFLIETPGDGVVEIAGLLWRYLSEARRLGVRVRTACPVTGVEVGAGAVRAVETPRGKVACGVLVNASGAWANTIAGLAGLSPLPLTVVRRHLVVTPPLAFVDPAWPVFWHLTRNWYFRPEVGGLLLSPCDEDPWEPGPATRDVAALEKLARKMQEDCPGLANLPVLRWWAGLRTLSADGRFLVGFDPRLRGFFWVAGLGGHGMTGSAVAGEVAAGLLTGTSSERETPWLPGLSPGRFLRATKDDPRGAGC